MLPKDLDSGADLRNKLSGLDARDGGTAQVAEQIAHEIRNYLAVIRGQAEVISIAIRNGDADVALRAADVIVEQVDRLEGYCELTGFPDQSTIPQSSRE